MSKLLKVLRSFSILCRVNRGMDGFVTDYDNRFAFNEYIYLNLSSLYQPLQTIISVILRIFCCLVVLTIYDQ